MPADPVSYNNTYLDADHRGCTSCHTLENALMSLPTYHRLIVFGYPTEQTFANCVACHSDSYSGRSLADPMHTLHLNSDAFVASGGTCQSCHYMDDHSNSFELWDEVKPGREPLLQDHHRRAQHLAYRRCRGRRVDLRKLGHLGRR